MNDLDKIAEEAAKKHYGGLPKGAREAARKMLAADIKAAIEKYAQSLLDKLPPSPASRAAHASEEDIKRSAMNIVNQVLDASGASVETRQQINDRCDNLAVEVISRLIESSRAAHASDDNCRKCGRPLGWFEPGLCDNCRAVQAGKPKPLERCSSNPHYEAHFGDEPATTAHASEQP